MGMKERSSRLQWILFVSVSILFFIIDLLSKRWAENFLCHREPLRVAGNFVQLVLVFNKGVIFGFDPRRFVPWFPLGVFFFVFSILAIIVILYYFSKLCRSDILMRWGLTFILPGALGNLADRIVHFRAGVVDFIRIGISETVYWPIFNAADVLVTVGVALIFISFFREERQGACKKNL
jgi:signal peptidase II